MITDEAKITVKAGDGGNGLISFRRERFVPRGGPDGGDGGKGGDVVILASPHIHSLHDFVTKREFKAKDGEGGKKKKRHGKDGEELTLHVPIGTVVWELNQNKTLLSDLKNVGDSLRVVQGGKGGFGNTHYASATHQTPRFAQSGFPGPEKKLFLELKLIADVGIIGRPNSGKSTLLSRISAAKPRIADYPFTTLEPNLGVARVHNRPIVLADIPGLIAGASQGKGLGDRFLKHIERTKIVIHLIDVTEQDLEAKYREIRKELELWSKILLEKKEIVVLNKIDAVPDYARVHQEFIKKYHPLAISAVSGQGIDKLLQKIFEEI